MIYQCKRKIILISLDFFRHQSMFLPSLGQPKIQIILHRKKKSKKENICTSRYIENENIFSLKSSLLFRKIFLLRSREESEVFYFGIDIRNRIDIFFSKYFFFGVILFDSVQLNFVKNARPISNVDTKI